MDWSGASSPVAQHALKLSEQCLAAYRANPLLVVEHANIELATAQGGYGRRQLYELIQNGADALIESSGGRIAVVLTDNALYCANEGAPIDLDGVEALLASHVSMKRGAEIGRFGLGFKSVLGVTRHPEFYSRSGSFVFDAIASRRRVREVVPTAERTPALRLATPITPTEAASTDPVLAELMKWATTVVKLPGGATAAAWLSADLENFPPEFLLFSSHVSTLELDDRANGTIRRISLTKQGDDLELSTAGESSRWRLFSRVHRPTHTAREDAGELANRETVPIHWAVSLAGARREGRFWAFFPTEYRTTLSGIINAPWKTNEDRQNLLAGPFNEELIAEAAKMVADEIGKLHSAEDPGRYLDLLPARGRETRNWADEHVTRSVYRELVERPSVADQDGILRRPDGMHVSPDKLSVRALTLWGSVPARPANWAHPSAAARDDRRSRVERLIVDAGGSVAGLSAWLHALVENREDVVASSSGAIRLAALLLEELPASQPEIRRAAIVLTADGRFVVPHPNSVYLPSDRTSPANVAVVSPDVVRDADTRLALERLGLRAVDPAAELEAAIGGRIEDWGDADWAGFWELTRTMDPAVAAGVLGRQLDSRVVLQDGSVGTQHRVAALLRVRTFAGRWRPLYRTLFAGRIVPADGRRDADIMVDSEFHTADVPLLELLGVTDTPVPWDRSDTEHWFAAYRSECVRSFVAALPAGGTQPNADYLVFSDDRALGPLAPLEDLSPEGKVLFTRHVLAGSAGTTWELKHLTRAANYPSQRCVSPPLWFVRRHGWVNTSLGPRPVDEAIGPALADFGAVMPVAEVAAHHASALELPETLEELAGRQWEEALSQLDRVEDDGVLGRFFAAASEHLVPPERIRCRIGPGYGSETRTLVCVTADRSEFAALIAESVPVLLLPSDADCQLLIEEWGLLAAEAKVVRRTVFVPSRAAAPLEDVFPGLRHFHAAAAAMQLQSCSELRKELVTESGKTHEPVELLVEAGTVYADERLDDPRLLSRLARELRFTLTSADVTDLLERRAIDQANRRKVAVREEPNDAARLVALVGAENVRRALPEPLLNAVQEIHGDIDGPRLGQVALAMYGPDALREFRDELDRQGLEPPTQWAGSPRAVRFVRELGFAGDFAGSETQSREPSIEVDGPRDLPVLHTFQREIADRVRRLLQQPDERRGLISLPTGAGKTRVAVQALVEAVRDDGFEGPVLWVADRDELCEQAVQAWIEVWRSLGPQRRLHISQFWSGNETAPVSDAFHVIVATIAKLSASINEPGYQWLSDVRAVVVDEAHASIGPSYTEVLNAVGLGRSQRRDSAALLGLTATPFRGTSAEETERLVARYGRRRLDLEVLGELPEVALQDMGVLAHVEQRLLRGMDLQLSPEELGELERLRLLPKAAEQRLGANVARNRTLLESIKALPEDWPVLLFATSVQHAQTMAALLTLEGIPAAAVSGETSPGVRRGYVEQFRAGRIRVLTNYAVLTQGFDAPSVRAVYIARPTYSPNVYQQMIGRGLRGPLNGGKEQCLIVNVQDNILQFGEQLAFHHFDYLWSDRTSQES